MTGFLKARLDIKMDQKLQSSNIHFKIEDLSKHDINMLQDLCKWRIDHLQRIIDRNFPHGESHEEIRKKIADLHDLKCKMVKQFQKQLPRSSNKSIEPQYQVGA